VRRGLADRKSLASALAQAIVDKEPSTRTVALFSYGAIGDLDKVFAGLSEAKSADFRRAATLVLQHGLAHKADADRSLRALLNKKGWPAGEAETVIQLLLGAGELGRPETYQTLINYLQHDKLAVRELADRMLHSLVPQGKGISYDAAGSAEQRGRGQAEWRRLIPEGKLPR